MSTPGTSTSFYDLLGVARTATDAEIKKAYYKAARQCHPDQNPDDPEATVQFQRLSHMYTILSNPDTRAHYDRWGDDDEEGGVRDEDPRNVFDVVAQFVRDLRRVTQDDLLVFAKEQAEAKLQDTVSKMEDEDLRAYYHRRKGDIRTMKEEVIGCETREDVQRFTQHLQNLVNAGELPQYDAFSDAVEKGKGKGRGKGRTKAKNPPATKTRAKRTKPRCE